MDRLPQKHLVPDPPRVEEMQVGDVRWVSGVFVDYEGVMYLWKKSSVVGKEHPGPVGTLYEFKVQRLEEGWKVTVPASYLPLEPKDKTMFESGCFVVTEIKIV